MTALLHLLRRRAAPALLLLLLLAGVARADTALGVLPGPVALGGAGALSVSKATAAPPVVWRGSALGGFSSSATVLTAAGASNMTWAPGMTFAAVLNVLAMPGNVGGTTETVVGCCAGGSAGWRLARNDQSAYGFFFYIDGSNTNKNAWGAAGDAWRLGVNAVVAVWRASDDHVLVSVAGSAQVDLGAASPGTGVNTTTSSTVGAVAGVGADAYLSSAEVVAFGLLAREATGAEARAWSAGNAPTGNRFQLAAAVEADAALTVSFNARRDWDGSAPTIVTRGSAPVTFPVVGTPALHVLDEAVIPTTDSLYSDSKVRATEAGDVRRSAFARVRLAGVSATQMGLDVYSTQTFAPQYATVGAFVGGAYTSSLGPVTAATVTTVDVLLGAGTKTVDLVEGNQVDPLTNGAVQGTYIRAVRLPVGSSPVPAVAPPQHRLVVFGDSVDQGFYVTTLQSDSLATLLRADYPTTGTGGVAFVGWGGATLQQFAGDGGLVSTWAAVVAAQLDGTVDSTLWVELGTNDYGNASWTAAAYGAAYGALLDAVHALRPAARVYCQSPLQRVSPATEAANVNGDTLGAFRARVAAVVAARPTWATYVEGAAGALVPSAQQYADGVHLTTAGEATYKAAVKSTLSYSVAGGLPADDTGLGAGGVVLALAAAVAGRRVRRAA